MDQVKIQIRPDLFLSGLYESDKPALLEYLSTRDVYDTTLNIPFPYTEKDADFWIQKRLATTQIRGIEATFAIRDGAGKLIGSVGADNIELARRGQNLQSGALAPIVTYRSHRAEIGYWLAREFWGRGIMTETLRGFIKYAFAEFELVRLTAHVFEGNLASSRVLEKNGFQLEGHLRRHFFKDGRFLDARLYGLLKQDFASLV